MEKVHRNCQSCGMPMKRDPQNGGSNSDGSKSTTYCSHCYEVGQFKQPNMTITEMQQFVKEKMKEFGFPGFIAGFFTNKIPQLERWQK